MPNDKTIDTYHRTGDVVQLRNADGRRLSDVRILVLETLAQRFAQILGDFVHPDAAHRANGQRPNQRVRVLTVL